MGEEKEFVLYRGAAGAAAFAGLFLKMDDLGLGLPDAVAGFELVEGLNLGDGPGITRDGLGIPCCRLSPFRGLTEG